MKVIVVLCALSTLRCMKHLREFCDLMHEIDLLVLELHRLHKRLKTFYWLDVSYITFVIVIYNI